MSLIHLQQWYSGLYLAVVFSYYNPQQWAFGFIRFHPGDESVSHILLISDEQQEVLQIQEAVKETLQKGVFKIVDFLGVESGRKWARLGFGSTPIAYPYPAGRS